MRRDRLAAGEASSQIYAASEAATQQQWDLAFLTPRQFIAKVRHHARRILVACGLIPMAMRPLQICRRCSAACDGPYCDAHQDTVKEYERERRRNDPFRRLYKTSRWAAIRMSVLARDPVCQDGRICEHRSLSAVVDHKIPAKLWCALGNDFFDDSNLRGSCKPCHDSKTATEDGGFEQ
jgi:5-methylcytosine-specific restriction enzyme A